MMIITYTHAHGKTVFQFWRNSETEPTHLYSLLHSKIVSVNTYQPYKKLTRSWDTRTWHRSVLLATPLAFNASTEASPWDDLRNILQEGQGMAKVQNGEEILPKVSTPWVGRTNVTNDRRICGSKDPNVMYSHVRVKISGTFRQWLLILECTVSLNRRVHARLSGKCLTVIFRRHNTKTLRFACAHQYRNINKITAHFWLNYSHFVQIQVLSGILLSKHCRPNTGLALQWANVWQSFWSRNVKTFVI